MNNLNDRLKTEKNNMINRSMGVDFLYKELFNNINSGVALYEAINEGKDFIVKDFNISAEIISGLKRERVIGKKISEIFPNVKKSGFLSILQNVWKTGKAERHPNVLYQSEKNSIWVECYAFKLSVGNIVAIFNEITERERSEQKLKDSEEKFRNLFEHSPIGIELYDSEGKLENANKACLDIFGVLDFKDVKGFILFNDPNIPEDFIEQLKKGKIVRFELEFDFEKIRQLNLYKTKKSGIIYLDVLITPLYSRAGNLISNYFVQIQDITQRKRTEELLHKSEARLHFLVSSSPAIIYTSKTSGDYGATYISQNVKMLTGYDSEEFTKDSNFWVDHIHPDEKERILIGLSKLYEKGHHLHEYRFRFKDGSYHWMIDDCNLVRDENNNPIETIGYWIDITERRRIEDALKESDEKLKELNEELEQDVEERTEELKESEKALRESQELLKKTLYSMKDAIFILNADSPPIIIDYNPIAEKIFGYSRGELIGQTTAFLHVDETSLRTFQEYLFPKIKQFGFIQNYEFKMKRKDGCIFPTEHNVSELRNEKREHIGWVSIVRDITERKETEEKLKESEEKYRNAFDREMLYKDIFIHDFNNLLQNIMSSVELSSLYLNDSKKLNNINELIDIIKEQVFRGKKLISNIRNLSQIEESGVSVKKIDLNRTLNDSIEFIKQSFKNKAINIRVEPLKEEMFVFANNLLSEVFENLLINSIRYTDKPVAEVLVKISKHQENGKNYIKMEFIDNGIGVTDELKVLIFQDGFVNKKRARGMGFGLSVVKKIIEHYNGNIWVENKVKGDFTQGSNFILLIPEAI